MFQEEHKVQLIAVHKCRQCGGSFLPEEINDDANVTGVVTCPRCGFSGPLVVDIIAEHGQ